MLLYNYILDICKYIPSVIIVSSLSFGVIFNNIRGFIFFGICICCNLINILLKTFIFKPIYYKFGNREIPILGRGDRPRGHPKLDMLENYYSHSVSYGMPSGHSQIMCLFSSFWILQIIHNKRSIIHNKKLNKPDDKSKTGEKSITGNLNIRDNISIVYLVLIALLVMYSRYIQRYHTIQQVILGGLIGVGLGVLSFFMFKKYFIKKKIKKKKIVKKKIPTNTQHETEILSGLNQYTRMPNTQSAMDNHLNERQNINRMQYNNDVNKALNDMEFKQQNIIHSNKLNEADEQIKTMKEYENSPPINKINVIG